MTGQLIMQNVTLAYDRGRAVLTGVDLVPEPGRIIAVTGHSGAGKTTLLWALAGLIAPSAGTITIDGVPLRDHDQAVASGVVLIPQDNGLATFLTGIENVMAVLLAGKTPDAEALADATFDRVGLGGQGAQLVEELSGGQQQRAAIARGLALRGHVLLADEPTSQLDARNRARVIDLLGEEAYRGAAVVCATHDQDVADACDMELHLSGGRAELLRVTPVQRPTSKPLRAN